MSEQPSSTIQVTCPCCSATLTIDPTLSVVLNHKLPAKPQLIAELNAAQYVKEEATRRDEKYQQIVEAEKNKSKVLEAKFQELPQEGQRRADHQAAKRHRYRLGVTLSKSPGSRKPDILKSRLKVEKLQWCYDDWASKIAPIGIHCDHARNAWKKPGQPLRKVEPRAQASGRSSFDPGSCLRRMSN
jgi:hypothetical protein